MYLVSHILPNGTMMELSILSFNVCFWYCTLIYHKKCKDNKWSLNLVCPPYQCQPNNYAHLFICHEDITSLSLPPWNDFNVIEAWSLNVCHYIAPMAMFQSLSKHMEMTQNSLRQLSCWTHSTFDTKTSITQLKVIRWLASLDLKPLNLM
jgi:hypothetical protein